MRSLRRIIYKTKYKKKSRDDYLTQRQMILEYRMGFYDPDNTGDRTPDPWLSPEKIKSIYRGIEANLNTNKITNPIAEKDRKKLKELYMDRHQYFAVGLISTRNLRSRWS